MQKNQELGDSFKLLIGLAEIHVPRMWVERLTGNPDSQVCNVASYWSSRDTHLLIGLAEIQVRRMWLEGLTENADIQVQLRVTVIVCL